MSAPTAPLSATFPGLHQLGPDGQPFVHADAPGGTQVVDSVIHAMTEYLSTINSNPNRVYSISVDSAALVSSVRRKCAKLVGASADGVVFGPSSTALTWRFARAFSPTLQAGDNIVCTQLDHDANVSPWLAIGRERGVEVRFVPLDLSTYQLDHSTLEHLVDERTRLVAFTRTSNLIGTVIPERPFVEAAQAVGALTFADGVAAAAHRPLEQFARGIDVSICSGYKFFGPHIAVLSARPELLEQYTPDKLRPAPTSGPRRWEQGMPALEAIAGLGAAVDYMIATGYRAIEARERELTRRVLDGLSALPHVRLQGVDGVESREPTFAVTIDGISPQDAALQLAGHGIFVSAGNNYALECVRALQLEAQGVMRFGLAHYHSSDDVDRIVDALSRIPIS